MQSRPRATIFGALLMSTALLVGSCGADTSDETNESEPSQGEAGTAEGSTAEGGTDGSAEEAAGPSWDPESTHVLVNAQNALEPRDYAPADLVEPDVRTSEEAELRLRAEPSAALEEMMAAIQSEDMELAATSGYRSYESQQAVYAENYAEDGVESTDETTARPGYSEHQTGLAVDVISIDNPDCIEGDCFADTPEGEWVAQNAHRFGFIIRYPDGAEDVTGYHYEPWHVRYVGEETAAEVFELDTTLEEYWDQPAAEEYDESEPDPEILEPPEDSSP